MPPLLLGLGWCWVFDCVAVGCYVSDSVTSIGGHDNKVNAKKVKNCMNFVLPPLW